jgi:outer membrane receptor for ferrienterochelin and colicin
MSEADSNGADLAQYGIIINRDTNGTITSVIAPNLNLASEAVTGIDFNMEIQLASNLYGHQLSLDNDYSYIISDEMSPFPGIEARNLIGEWGMPRWRNTATLNMKNDVTSYAVTMRSIGKQNIQDREVDEKISDLNEFDISATYKFSKVSLSGGIKNIMDATQPLDSFGGTGGTAAFNSSLYDINGRKFFVSYTQKF